MQQELLVTAIKQARAIAAERHGTAYSRMCRMDNVLRDVLRVVDDTRTTMLKARDALHVIAQQAGTDYDWNADLLQLTLKQSEALEAIDIWLKENV